MRGALRSKRCQRCRRRKIKCDEDWPTCGPCVRAAATCSGPPIGDRFPEESVRSSSSSEVHVTQASRGGPQSPTTSSPGGLRRRRPPSPLSPRPDPTTIAERVAARLVAYLDKGSTSFDASLAACYLKLLPSHLGDSPALRDAVALFCSCWANFRRSHTPQKLIEPKPYGKALRSLQAALNDPGHQLRDETLAATALMDRVEVMFDVQRRYGRITHARGISSLITKRGPPSPDNELAILLTLEGHNSLMYSSQFDGATNVFLLPQWRTVLDTILQNDDIEVPADLKTGYLIDQEIRCWPQVLIDLQNLKEPLYPVYDPSASPSVRLDKAQLLYEKLEPISARLMTQFRSYRDAALQEKEILVQADTESVIGSHYTFADMETAKKVMGYLTLLLSVNRVRYELCLITGRDNLAPIDAELKMLSKEVWMSLEYMRKIGPICGVLFSFVLTLALEAGDPVERKYLLDTMLDLDKHKRRLPLDLEELEDIVAYTTRVYLGRATMGDLQRF